MCVEVCGVCDVWRSVGKCSSHTSNPPHCYLIKYYSPTPHTHPPLTHTHTPHPHTHPPLTPTHTHPSPTHPPLTPTHTLLLRSLYLMRYSRMSDVTSLNSCSCSRFCGAACVAMVITPVRLINLETRNLSEKGTLKYYFCCITFKHHVNDYLIII